MERGATTAPELATTLELTAAAVRRHLAALGADGLITTRERKSYRPRGRGRPAKVYVPTDAGRSGFEQAYDELAIDVLDFLARQLGPEAVADFARHRYQQVARRYEPEIAESDAPAEALATLLTDDGFMATVHPVRSGQQLCQHHCPVATVAVKYPEICAAETEAFGTLLRSHVQRLATIAHGDGVCTLHIPRPVTQGEQI